MKRWLRKLFLITEKTTIAPVELERVYSCLEAMAEDEEVDICPYFSRVGQIKQTLYYNLANSEKQLVRVAKNGVFVVDNSKMKVKFKPSITQVFPDLDSPPEKLLELLQPFFRVESEGEQILLASFIVSSFVYEINHPLLVLSGSAGSAKSSTMEIIARIVDPHSKNRLTMNPDRKSMVSILGNRFFLAFDNLTVLKKWQSDLLCNASTGGSEPMRVLYTTSSTIEINVKGVVCLNGIAVVATEPDLLDRSLLIQLTRIPDDEYIPEDEIYKKLELAMPAILGSIFSTLSKAITLHETIEDFPRVRMQDFAKWAYCIAEAVGGYGEVFNNAYTRNRSKAVKESRLPLAEECICTFMRHRADWCGTMAELRDLLQPISRRKGYSRYDFPANASALSREINGLKTALEYDGIEVKRKKSNQRNITIINHNTDE